MNRVIHSKMFINSSRFMNRLAYAACLFCLCLTANRSMANETNMIVLFGDSITFGDNNNFNGPASEGVGSGRTGNDGLSPPLPPSDKLDALLDEEFRESIVINWGVGGTSTESGTSRILSNLNSSLNDHTANNRYILILYGTNDFAFGLSPSTTGFNIRLMIDRARSLGFIPVIGTLTPRDDRNVSNYNSTIVANANARGAPVVDHYSRFLQDGNGGLDLLDLELFFNGNLIRLHPTDEGYDVIAQTWFDQYLSNELVEVPPTLTVAPIIQLLLDD